MKILLITSTIIALSGLMPVWEKTKPVSKSSTVSEAKINALKLAEAKAFLSEAKLRNSKVQLGTADGGI